jgi:hypothetical protein
MSKVQIWFVLVKADHIPVVAAKEATVVNNVPPASGEDNTDIDNNQQHVVVHEPLIAVEVPEEVKYPSPEQEATNAHIKDANDFVDANDNNNFGYTVPDTPDTVVV